MGFLRGVIAGMAVSAAAAAWYLSRSGAQARDQLQLERRLGEVGDQLERRAREIQQQVNAQVAEIQRKSDAANGKGTTLDDVETDATSSTADAVVGETGESI